MPASNIQMHLEEPSQLCWKNSPPSLQARKGQMQRLMKPHGYRVVNACFLLSSHQPQRWEQWTVNIFTCWKRDPVGWGGGGVSGGFVLSESFYGPFWHETWEKNCHWLAISQNIQSLLLKDGHLTTQEKDHAYIYWYPWSPAYC